MINDLLLKRKPKVTDSQYNILRVGMSRAVLIVKRNINPWRTTAQKLNTKIRGLL